MQKTAQDSHQRRSPFRTGLLRVALASGMAAGTALLLPYASPASVQPPTNTHHAPKHHVMEVNIPPVAVGISGYDYVPDSECSFAPLQCSQDDPAYQTTNIIGYANIKKIAVSEDTTGKGKVIKGQKQASLQLNTNLVLWMGFNPENPNILWTQNVVNLDMENSQAYISSSIALGNNTTYTDSDGKKQHITVSGKGSSSGGYYGFYTNNFKFDGKATVYLSINLKNQGPTPTLQFGYVFQSAGKTHSGIFDTVSIGRTDNSNMDSAFVSTLNNPVNNYSQMTTDLVFCGPYNGEKAIFSKMDAQIGLYSPIGGFVPQGPAVYGPFNIGFDRSGATGETASNIKTILSKESYPRVVIGKLKQGGTIYDNAPLPPLLRNNSTQQMLEGNEF